MQGIISLREKAMLTQSSLADRAGVNRITLNHIEKGTRPPSNDAQWMIAAAFDMTPEQVMLYAMHNGDYPQDPPPRPFQIVVNSPQELALLESPEENYRGVPLYESGRLAAGPDGGIYFNDNEFPESEVLIYRPELKHRAHHSLAAVRVGGDSMSPTIPKNSIIVVDMSDREYFKRKIFCVNDPDDTGMWVSAVKRVQEWDRGFVLISDNPDVPPKITSLDWKQLCVGRVIWMWRNTEEL